MAQRVEPRIRTHSLVLDLPSLDPAFTQPLFAHLSILNSTSTPTGARGAGGSVMLFVGGAPLPFAMSRDASVAMQRPNGPPAATSLSKTNSASLALSGRLAKRYGQQVFLSLDLSSLGDGGAATADRAMMPMERALIVELDKVLERKRAVAA
ncbi:hypothetical protein JCM11251_002132 [Rhodosporidiobolus azoricus]